MGIVSAGLHQLETAAGGGGDPIAHASYQRRLTALAHVITPTTTGLTTLSALAY